jgi:hypothetical protein
LEGSFSNWAKLVPVFCHLNFWQDEITNFKASRANVTFMITPHRLLVFNQLDDCDLM